ncbi:MAG: hypothetical protein Q8R34_01470 [bacterium]|nr:hypothetical protein [bacterium]
MRRCFYLALLAVFLACLPRAGLAQEPSPMIVDQPRLSKTVFTNWDPIEVIFTVRYLDGYEPDMERIKSLSFPPFELDSEVKENPKIVRKQKYREENYFDIVYSLRMIAEKKGEVVLPAQKFYYIKLEPGKPREELEVKEFETKEVQLRYDHVLTSKADDIIDRIDFGDFGWQAWFWKGLALAGFILSALLCWVIALRYHPVLKNKKESLAESSENVGPVSSEQVLTSKEARKSLLKALDALEIDEEEFKSLIKIDSPKRRQKEADLCNALRTFLLSHVDILTNADTAKEMLLKISSLDRSFRNDSYFYFASRLGVYEKGLYKAEPLYFWKYLEYLEYEVSYSRQELMYLNWPVIWWKEFAYRWRSSGRTR